MDEQLTDSFGSQTKEQAEKTMRQNLTDSGYSFDESGKIAVDTLSRPADQNVNREVDLINQAQDRQPSTALTADITKAVSTVPPVEKTRDDFRSDASEVLAEIQGTNIAESTAEVREREEVALKEERARNLSNNLIARERDIQKQREALEKNPNKRSGMGLQSELAKFNRESARELADLSFSYQVALGDYQAAEKIASDYADDLQQDLTNKQNTWQMLMKMSEMTDEEKMIAQQNFQEKQAQDQFELNKKLASFNSELRTQEEDAKYLRERNAEIEENQILMDLFGGGSTGQQEIIPFDEYLAEAQEQSAMSFTPETISQLESQYNQQLDTIGGTETEMQKINQAVMSGVISPQQANFMIENMDITTPKQRGRQSQVIETGRGVLRDIDRALELAPNAGVKMSSFLAEGSIKSDAGLIRQGLASFIAKPEIELAQHLESIKSNISIEELQRMRENSPTGGALGQVPVQQQEFLMSVKGSLRVSLGTPVLEENLNDLYNIYLDAMFGSPDELGNAVKEGRLSANEANSYLQQRKQSSFDEFNLPVASSGGQNINNLHIAPDGSLVNIQ